MIFFSDYFKVTDNNGCGGHNVSFTGTYRITRPTDLNQTTTHVYPKTETYFFPEGTKTITWPIIKNLNPKSLTDNINNTLDFNKTTGTNIAEIKSNPQGITSTYYEVNYDQNNILSLSIFVENTGAYISTFTYNYSFDLTTGQPISSTVIFSPDKTNSLITLLNSRLQTNINQALKRTDCPPDLNVELESNKKYYPHYGNFSSDDLDFRITYTGIEFIYNFHFPHVILACEPDSIISLTYSQLKDFIRFDGLLSVETKKL